MRRSLVLASSVLFVVGLVLGFYASQRNCLVAFLTGGYMSFWTGMEILGGFLALTAIVIVIIGFIKDK